MTNMPTDIMEELSSMEDLIDQADARRSADRDMSVPVGAEIATQNLGNGSKIVQTKQNSLAVTANGTPLPGRTPVYYRLGQNQVRWVDTGRLAHHLGKRVNGERVFSLKPWPLAEAKVYEKTCELCLNGPDHVTKRFVEDENGDGETKYIAHMRAFHAMQFETIQRQIERDERREEQALLREMLATIARKDESPTAVDVEALLRERLREMGIDPEAPKAEKHETAATVPCPDCGQMFKNQNGLRLHGVKHKAAVTA